MSKQEIVKMADKLLLQHGFSTDGGSYKGKSKRQMFFEKRTIIMTPMGNGRK